MIPFLALYSVWLIVCLPFSIIGLILPVPKKELQSDLVELSPSVCKTLNIKGLLSQKDFEFETQTVAPNYDLYTFKGYRLVMAPVIRTLKSFNFLDNLLLNLVNQWMKVHKHWIDSKNDEVSFFKQILTQLLTTLAHGLGRTLYWVSPKGTFNV